jgi:hypothetical protein
MDELKSAGLLEYATVCGETLARGHARSGDPGVIAGYIGSSARFDVAIAQFAADYATQTERDWQSLMQSRSSAKPGVVLAASDQSRRRAATKSKAGKKRTRKSRRTAL